MLCADLFIYLVYMFFGLFQYSYQGQYTYNVAIQSINPYNYQTAGNVLATISKPSTLRFGLSITNVAY